MILATERRSPSNAMRAGLARNRWAVGLRGLAAALFVLAILTLPTPAIASMVLLFSAYVAADGVFAILAGARAARRGERWRLLMVEGATNLAVAGGVLAWQAITLVPFLRLASAWAMVTSALALAAAHRLTEPHGRWLLALAGGISVAWGVFAAAFGPSAASDPRVMGQWLVGYAVIFGASLLTLAVRLRRRHGEASTASTTRL